MFVGQHLKLNVARVLDILLHVEVTVSEGSGGLGLSRFEKSRQFFFVAHNAHAASAAPGRRLHDDRKAYLPRPFDRFAVGGNDPIRPRQNRHARLLHSRAGLLLLSHEPRDFRSRPDELDAAGLAHFGKVRILRQQTVAGMHRLDIRNFCSADDSRNVQIALRQLWRPNANRLIGKAHGQGIPVRLAVDCDRADPELLARANDAQGDLSAISHQNLLKHVRVRVSPGDSPFHAGHSPAACPLLLRQTQKGAQARAPMSNQFTSLALLQTAPAHTQSAARSQPVS